MLDQEQVGLQQLNCNVKFSLFVCLFLMFVYMFLMLDEEVVRLQQLNCIFLGNSIVLFV